MMTPILISTEHRKDGVCIIKIITIIEPIFHTMDSVIKISFYNFYCYNLIGNESFSSESDYNSTDTDEEIQIIDNVRANAQSTNGNDEIEIISNGSEFDSNSSTSIASTSPVSVSNDSNG